MNCKKCGRPMGKKNYCTYCQPQKVQAEPKKKSKLWLWLVIAAVCVAAAVTAIVLLMTGSSGNTNVATEPPVAARVRQGIFHAVGGKFALDGLLGAAEAGALRVAALHHKAAYYAMKSKAVIEAFICQLYKISNGYRRVVAVQRNGYNAVIGNVYFRIIRCILIQCRGLNARGRLCRGFGGGCGFVGGKLAGAQHQRAHKHSHHKHNMLSYFHSVTSIKNTG